MHALATAVRVRADRDERVHRESAINGNQLDNSLRDSGAAYVFVRDGNGWSQQAYLKASNPDAGDCFGSVAISGNTIVVGAPFEDSNAVGVNGDQFNNLGTDSGAAYVFVREGTNWTHQAYLKLSNTESGEEFGGSVAMSGDTILVGVSGDDSFYPDNGEWRYDHGSAYVFRVPYDLDAFVESINRAGNTIVLECSVEPGSWYDVERCTHWTNWTAVHTTNAPPGGVFHWADVNPPESNAFYRLKRH
ncbi:MAG: FG-GAP repeat protein [Verrucomicrobiae bacterium]|nr:FG-GAP repeat protein [Verrucomicrobiae bacterium]